jgi:hypothetical protein
VLFRSKETAKGIAASKLLIEALAKRDVLKFPPSESGRYRYVKKIEGRNRHFYAVRASVLFEEDK